MGSDMTERLNLTDIFFSTGQVLLSTLSWYSACTSVSEGVFLMYLQRKMYSMSTYSSAILFSQWRIFDRLHNPESEQLVMGYCGSLQDWEGRMSPKVVWLMEMNNTHTKGKGGGPDGQRKTCVNFLSLAIKYEFYFISSNPKIPFLVLMSLECTHVWILEIQTTPGSEFLFSHLLHWASDPSLIPSF